MLVVELLVLLLIAYEGQKFYLVQMEDPGSIGGHILEWMSKGQMLQQNRSPAGFPDEADSTAWVAAVQQWMEQDAHHFLAKYSPQAAASFIHHKVVHRYLTAGFLKPADARGWYATLHD